MAAEETKQGANQSYVDSYRLLASDGAGGVENLVRDNYATEGNAPEPCSRGGTDKEWGMFSRASILI